MTPYFARRPDLVWVQAESVGRTSLTVRRLDDGRLADLPLHLLTAPAGRLHDQIGYHPERTRFWHAAAESLVTSELPLAVSGWEPTRDSHLWRVAGREWNTTLTQRPDVWVGHLHKHWLSDDRLLLALTHRDHVVHPLTRSALARAVRAARRESGGPSVAGLQASAWAAFEAYVSVALLALTEARQGDVVLNLTRTAPPSGPLPGLRLGLARHLVEVGSAAVGLERPIAQGNGKRTSVTSWLRRRDPVRPNWGWATTYAGEAGTLMSDAASLVRHDGVTHTLEHPHDP